MSPSTVPVEYRLLHKYLGERFADIVVLTFTQIEDLIGRPLPQSASRDLAWWADAAADLPEATQSRAWTEAKRNATPNLTARTVMFERMRS